MLCRRILHREIDETSSHSKQDWEQTLAWVGEKGGSGVNLGLGGGAQSTPVHFRTTAVGTSPGQGVEWPKHDGGK